MKSLSEYPDAHLRIFDRPSLPDADALKSVYLIGICGTGMGSLAGLFRDAGYVVSGSDATAYPPMSVVLAEQGIHVWEGFDPVHLKPLPDLVIVGNACTPTHPEAAASREQGLAQASLPEALANYFIRDRKSIVVAGTHGKTTTTSMLAHVFINAGLDPGFLVGGIMNNGNRSYAVGSGAFFIVEGDEYDSAYFDKQPKFLHYRPTSAIVTSVEFDHADIYHDWDEYLEAFKIFSRLVPRNGLLALCDDDPVMQELAAVAQSRIAWYGSKNAYITARNVVSTSHGQTFQLIRDGEPLGSIRLTMSGRHNLHNALAVCAVALDENLPFEALQNGLASFSGIQRRQQIRGESNGVTVVDDFAHHPTAVKATIEAITERFPGQRIVAIFEPRSNSSRRKVFEEGYSNALEISDAVFLSTPPFRHNDDLSNFMDIGVVLNHLTGLGKHAVAREGADALIPEILDFLRPGDVALIMSNGGFGNIHQRLLDLLAE